MIEISELREIQNCELDILKAVVALCEKHGLCYYLSSGTLLGAVRHQGFIPWDDDIDIEMPVKDYYQFLKYARKELDPSLFLQTYMTDPGYNELWAKIRKNGTTSMPVKWKNWNIHFGICIDIFPLVGVYSNPLLRRLQRKLLEICRMLLAKDYLTAIDSEELKSNSKARLAYLLPNWVRRTLVRVFENFIFHKTEHEPVWSIIETRVDYEMKASDYSEQKCVQFEHEQMKAPSGYNAILKKWYGDYMTPPPDDEKQSHELTLGNIIYDCQKDYKAYR